MARAVIYKRVSTLKQVEEGQSLQVQEDRLKAYIFAQGWELVDVYEDAGLSGSNTDRPAFQKMLRDAHNKKFDCIVVYKLDRLTRSVKDFHELADELDSIHVNIVSVTQCLDTSTPTGRLMRNILIDFANFERELIRERMNDSKITLAQQGKFMGSTLPFGYKYTLLENGNKEIVIVPEEADIVRKIFNDSLLGLSDRKLNLKYENIPRCTPSKIIRNEFYCGTLIYSRRKQKGTNVKIAPKENWIVSEGNHPKIIDKELFNKIQLIRNDRYRAASYSKNVQIFDNLIYCGTCGTRLTYHRDRKDLKEVTMKDFYKYYKCSKYNKKDKQSGCNLIIHENIIEESFLNLIDEMLKSDFLDKAKAIIQNNNDNLDKQKEVFMLEKQLKSISKKMDNLLTSLAEASPGVKSMIINNLNELEKQQKNIQNKIIDLTPNLNINLEYDYDILKNVRYEYVNMTLEERMNIIKILYKRIYIYKNRLEFEFHNGFRYPIYIQ